MVKNVLIGVLAAGLLAALIVNQRPVVPESVPVVPAPAPQVEAQPFADLDALLDEALAKEGMRGAAVGLCVLGAEGEVVFDRNARTAFIPASSLKTLTTATALEVFGPDHRILTQVREAGEGDVILLGGGDPMLEIADLQDLAAPLRGKGVTRVIGDGRLFGGSIFDDFWNWGDIGNGYGSGVSGLNAGHNRFRVTLAQGGGGVGGRAQLMGVSPEVPGVTFVNETVLADAHSGDGVVIHGGERTDTVFLRGTVPANGLDLSVTGAVPDPERFAAHHFAGALGAADAVGASSLAEVPEAGEVLAEHLSPPLLEIVRSIHYTSDNHETECIHLLLGLHAGKPPVTAIREHWAGRGLVFEGLRMEDGSGLARADFITPHDLAKLQLLAGSGPQGEAYKNSLIERHEGALRWKGGAMSSVRSYAGYATGADGRERSFALMVNHYTDARQVSELREAVWAELRGIGG